MNINESMQLKQKEEVNLQQLRRSMEGIYEAILSYICNCPSTIERTVATFRPSIPDSSSRNLHNSCGHLILESFERSIIELIRAI